MGRREETTAALRGAALDILVEVGPRALTHERVAQRAFFSVGAVYQRWPDRAALLGEVADLEVIPALERLGRASDLSGWRAHILADPSARRTVLALAELLFAARDEPALVELARTGAAALMAGVPTITGPPLDGALRWWLCGLALGDVLLERCGCHSPTTDEAQAAGGPYDDTARALLEAARLRIAQSGTASLSVREAASAAGVTTGALYRRFPSRDALVAHAVAEAALGDRDRWLLPLVGVVNEHGLHSPEADSSIADAAARASTAWADRESRDFLLEVAAAAHTADPVRAQLAARVVDLVASRSAELIPLEQEGALPSGMTAAGLTWLLQTAPIGLRLLASAGIEPTTEEVESLVRLAVTLALGLET